MIYIYTGVRKRAYKKLEWVNKVLMSTYRQQGERPSEEKFIKEQIDKYEYIRNILEEILDYEMD